MMLYVDNELNKLNNPLLLLIEEAAAVVPLGQL